MKARRLTFVSLVTILLFIFSHSGLAARESGDIPSLKGNKVLFV
jgi:hypothetical protein